MAKSAARVLDEAIDVAREGMLAAKGPEARFAALTSSLAAAGLDQINYGFFDPEAAYRSQADVVLMSTMPESWLGYYHTESLQLTDPHVLHVRGGSLEPYAWGRTKVDALDDARQRRTARRIAEAGQRSALCTPLTSPLSARIPVAGMTLGSSLDEREFSGITGGEGWRLISLVHQFHDLSLGEFHRREIGAQPLTPRERDCLRYAAEGLQQDAIGHRLGLARVTVETHLRKARKKLKTRSLPQAVARAIVFGEIPPA